ncbi:hypothetical protein [Thermus phage P23-45]|uniref:Uncharacterized protein n=1 Tax=Thermus virus P23-45 TaxID=2914006 RepID=A7XXC6_BP234|nr:hypothetical protein P23p92 [Thermus phage P23-45]ABU96925.1 hypothetical protein P23p92 [Thermus phage P23-45]UYB98499.1 hypothetical protein [Thermus phage P23-45]
MRIRLKEAKVLRRPDLAPFKNKLLSLYYKHLRQLVAEYISERIASGRLGRSTWKRYAYYRTWIAGTYGSDRSRKAVGARKVRPNAVERLRLQALARRMDKVAANRRVRKELDKLIAEAKKLKDERARERFVQSYLKNRESSVLAQWLAYTPVGRRVLQGVERDLNRLATYYHAFDAQRDRPPSAKTLRQRLQAFKAPVLRGWKYAKQTGLLAKAWREAVLEIKNGRAYIMPLERYDKLPDGKRSLSGYLARVLRKQGGAGRFLGPGAFAKLSKRAMERAAAELGVKLK